MGLTPVLKDQMMWNTPKESCEVLVQHSAKAHDQHVRDLCHLSSRCECITGELGRRQETFFSPLFRTGKAIGTAVHKPKLITLTHATVGTFPLEFISEEIHIHQDSWESLGSESEIKSPTWNKLLVSFLAAGQLRCWYEYSNYSTVKKKNSSTGQLQKVQFRHTWVTWDTAPASRAFLVFTTVITTWSYLRAAMLGLTCICIRACKAVIL